MQLLNVVARMLQNAVFLQIRAVFVQKRGKFAFFVKNGFAIPQGWRFDTVGA
jgi:N-acetylglutamate synthase-like GNAT family acetyltransferase